jgi:hypothetical protein
MALQDHEIATTPRPERRAGMGTSFWNSRTSSNIEARDDVTTEPQSRTNVMKAQRSSALLSLPRLSLLRSLETHNATALRVADIQTVLSKPFLGPSYRGPKARIRVSGLGMRKIARRCALVRYLRAKRSKSAIWRSISSRAESEAERMPWMRRLNSSGLEERESASSRVMSCLV